MLSPSLATCDRRGSKFGGPENGRVALPPSLGPAVQRAGSASNLAKTVELALVVWVQVLLAVCCTGELTRAVLESSSAGDHE